MGVPNSEVGYTAAMPRREDHEVHKDMWWHWGRERERQRERAYTIILSGKNIAVRLSVPSAEARS